MSLPEGYLPKEGDIVLIRAVVRFDFDDTDAGVHLKIGGYNNVSVNLTDIESLKMHAWKIGDRAKTDRYIAVVGTIIGLDDDVAWLKLDGDPTLYDVHRTAELIPVAPASKPQPDSTEQETPI